MLIPAWTFTNPLKNVSWPPAVASKAPLAAGVGQLTQRYLDRIQH
jgi:hypothetical protein